jgi:hypothetical protein
MIGHDADAARLEDWQCFARQWRSLQLDLLGSELRRVAGDRSPLLVAAGCGSFLVTALAQRLHCRQVAFATLAGAPSALRDWTDVCAPAVAVALLASDAMGTTCTAGSGRDDDWPKPGH